MGNIVLAKKEIQENSGLIRKIKQRVNLERNGLRIWFDFSLIGLCVLCGYLLGATITRASMEAQFDKKMSEAVKIQHLLFEGRVYFIQQNRAFSDGVIANEAGSPPMVSRNNPDQKGKKGKIKWHALME